MEYNSILPIQTRAVTPIHGPSQVPHGGDGVFVRVLQNTGNGSYLVSLAGNRIEVQSERILHEGDSFTAQLRLSDGKVLLVPKSPPSAVPADSLPAMYADGGPNGELAALLEAEGFIPDAVTVKLLQFLQQGGLRIDRSIMNRARAVASRFPGRERQAAEIAAALLEKGLQADDSAVLPLLAVLDSGSGGREQRNDADEETREERQRKDDCFLRHIYADDAGVGNRGGMLTLMNHLATNPEHHWIVLPYQWQTERFSATGIIRILLNLQTQTTEKVQISCRGTSTNYFFVLYYTRQNGLKEIHFYTDPPLAESARAREEKRLRAMLHGCVAVEDSLVVRYDASAVQDGLYADSSLPVHGFTER